MSTFRIVIKFDRFLLTRQRHEEFVCILDRGGKLHQHGSVYPIPMERARIIDPMVEGRAIGRSPDLAFCSLDSSKTVVFVILSVTIECTVCQRRRDKMIRGMRNRKTGQPACATEPSDPDLCFSHKPPAP